MACEEMSVDMVPAYVDTTSSNCIAVEDKSRTFYHFNLFSRSSI